jgi:acyl carrier protein
MLTAKDIEERFVVRIRELAPADKLPADLAELLSARIDELPLDSLDLLTLAMKLEDDLGRVIEMDMLDESSNIRMLAAKFSSQMAQAAPDSASA